MVSAAIISAYYYLTVNTFWGRLTQISFETFVHPRFSISLESAGAFGRSIHTLTDVFFWPLVFVFPATLCMGASFPLIASLALKTPNQEGRTVGSIYFANILGNVCGGLATGFLLLTYIGTENTLLAFTSIGVMAGLFVNRVGGVEIHLMHRLGLATLILICLFIGFPAKGAVYRAIHQTPFLSHFKSYFEEGRDGVVMTFKKDDQVHNYINGLQHGGRPFMSFVCQAVEGASYARKVENVLIIGFGTGTITETILKIEGLKKIVLVELNAALIKNLKKIELFENILDDHRVDLMNDDGRRFLLRSKTTFDLILADPLRSTTSYSNNLYSYEFNQLVERHLTPGGVFVVWMDERRVIPKTIAAAFGHTRRYSFFCLASNAPFKRNVSIRVKLLNQFSEKERMEIAHQIRYMGDQTYIARQTPKYPLNRDLRPVSEYFIGLKVKKRLGLW